jgi:Myristoyl-CoA:protein N-myristoyltransferase, C-terminal domain
VPGRTPLLQLLSDALILAKRSGHDVYNALDLMQNMEVFKVSGLGPSLNSNLCSKAGAICVVLCSCALTCCLYHSNGVTAWIRSDVRRMLALRPTRVQPQIRDCSESCASSGDRSSSSASATGS